MSPMPRQKPGKSKQDYGTPKSLLDKVKYRLVIDDFDWDLAASEENTVVTDEYNNAKLYYDETDDALIQHWKLGDGWNWLNPPFADLEPWVSKAAHEASKGAQTVVLVPASVGANWWKGWVEPYAYTVFLNGRIKFVGETDYYPKDCALLFYTPWGFKGSEIWSWNEGH